MRTAVVVMSKIPEPGYTKTRLNTILSAQESAEFHRACLADTCRAIRQSELPGYIYYAEQTDHPQPASASFAKDDLWGLNAEERTYFKLYPQQGEGLGERLYHAAQEILTRYEAVLLLGSDMPEITADIIIEAQAKMLSSEIVVGPAHDGGYYLLGVKQACSYIFQNIPWGTAQVLAKTLERISDKQLTFSLLPTQADIDTWDELVNFYYRGQANENNFYRQLAAYQLAARLVEKYSLLREGVSKGE